MHEYTGIDGFGDNDPNNQNRRDIFIVIALICGVLLLSMAWWESTHPREVPAPDPLTPTTSPDCPAGSKPTTHGACVQVDPYPEPAPVVPLIRALAEDEWLSAPIEIPMAQILTLGQGTVVIDLETGNVTFGEGVTPDEASREFWLAIGAVLPVCSP